MDKRILSIGFMIYISMVISGCTTPLITMKIEEQVKRTPASQPTKPALVCTAQTVENVDRVTDQPTVELDDNYPKLPPIDEKKTNDREYIIEQLLNYIEELQQHIQENS